MQVVHFSIVHVFYKFVDPESLGWLYVSVSYHRLIIPEIVQRYAGDLSQITWTLGKHQVNKLIATDMDILVGSNKVIKKGER